MTTEYVRYYNNRVSEKDCSAVLDVMNDDLPKSFGTIAKETSLSRNRLHRVLQHLQSEGTISSLKPDPYKPAWYQLREQRVDVSLLRMDLIPTIMDIASAHSGITALQTVNFLRTHHKIKVDKEEITMTLEYLSREQKLHLRQIGLIVVYSKNAEHAITGQLELPNATTKKAKNARTQPVRKARHSEVHNSLFA